MSVANKETNCMMGVKFSLGNVTFIQNSNKDEREMQYMTKQ